MGQGTACIWFQNPLSVFRFSRCNWPYAAGVRSPYHQWDRRAPSSSPINAIPPPAHPRSFFSVCFSFDEILSGGGVLSRRAIYEADSHTLMGILRALTTALFQHTHAIIRTTGSRHPYSRGHAFFLSSRVYLLSSPMLKFSLLHLPYSHRGNHKMGSW